MSRYLKASLVLICLLKLFNYCDLKPVVSKRKCKYIICIAYAFLSD